MNFVEQIDEEKIKTNEDECQKHNQEEKKEESNDDSEAECETLITACQNEQFEVVQLLLQQDDIDVNVRNNWGATPLLITVQNNNVPIVKLLLNRHDVELNVSTIRGETPLLVAIKNDHVEIVKMLLVNGANVNENTVLCGEPITPLIMAIHWYYGHMKTIQVLLDHGANVNQPTIMTKKSPLFVASAWAYEEVIDALLSKGANVHQVDADGRTPLSVASYHGHTKVVKTLLRHSANVYHTDNFGYTPTMYAREGGHSNTLTLLIKEEKTLPVKLNESTPKESEIVEKNQDEEVENGILWKVLNSSFLIGTMLVVMWFVKTKNRH